METKHGRPSNCKALSMIEECIRSNKNNKEFDKSILLCKAIMILTNGKKYKNVGLQLIDTACPGLLYESEKALINS